MAEPPGTAGSPPPPPPQPPSSSSSSSSSSSVVVAAAASASLDPDFPPQSRPRSCTWPLPRPEAGVPEPEPGGGGGGGGVGPGSGLGSPEEPVGGAPASASSSSSSSAGARKSGSGGGGGGGGGSGGGSSSSSGGARRNAWGSQSYADLISQAIESAPEKRLTLAQIYEWMVRSVPYFRDKGDSNSSAGWKNSIRHNLSLHSKFMKVHNEATGKSSWWMLNPEGGKSGKAPRRRAASMDNSSKLAKVRGKASKKKAAMQVAPEPTADSPGSQYPKWPGSPSSRSNEDSEVWTSIRPRTSSNASNLSVRLSPILTEQDDLPDEELLVYSGASNNVPPTVTEELELIDSLNLMSPSSSLLPAPQQPSSGLTQRNASFPLQAQSSTAQASSFNSSLFSPVEISLHNSAGHFSGPQTLEALLTSNSPPPSDVMMTQVDPILPQSGGRLNSQTFLLLGEQPSKSKVSPINHLRKPLEQQQQRQQQQLDSVGASPLPSAFSMVASPQNAMGMSGLKTSAAAQSPQVVQLGAQASLSGVAFAPFGGSQDRLPNDLDVDMYMENLECDVDYIINTDLMDGEGLDFNFEPIPSAPSYPSTSQASNHTWVPS